ncbi:hypothetical protein QBC46DRAFT_394873 [Diplogelasinospora grovesii]|uniref:Uncharacterized protein n=1 Tax=Diplogelasinospora grovesii TaxID=303347 RepID=A0AAN6MZZ9_9PEZI|nr:hypothetical protein QBC46DRAFT_394873 [Diplogelasinospora grovesii]
MKGEWQDGLAFFSINWLVLLRFPYLAFSTLFQVPQLLRCKDVHLPKLYWCVASHQHILNPFFIHHRSNERDSRI